MTRIVTFGEIMGRFTPSGFARLRQSMPGSLNVTFAGAEANVAASLSMFGADATFVTALPANDLADACIASLQSLSVASHIIRTDYGRLGLYFLETGANQRPSRVVYDRDHSAISMTEADVYEWDQILEGATWFHVTGITPALSAEAAQATIAAVSAAKQLGVIVSCDLNFRGKLWRWGEQDSPRELARQTMAEVLPFVDIVIANEEDCADVLGIHAEATDVHSGNLDISHYPDVARRVVERFSNVRQVAITLRESVSASHNRWGAMLYDAGVDEACFAPNDASGSYLPYEIRNIVDRVGGGDSFAAGLIYASTRPDYESLQDRLSFAVAASCLAHSIPGDTNFSSLEEVERLAAGSASGRVVR